MRPRGTQTGTVSGHDPCALCRGLDRRVLFQKRARHLVRCAGCGLVWVDPLPTREELATYYERSYREGSYAMFDAARDVRRSIAAARFRRIDPRARGGRWLDVGCSTGDFVEIVAAHGIRAEGIELSEAAVREARSRGLTVHHGSLEAFEPPHTYETITAFDVIEHLLDPRAFVERLRRWLAPGGTLVMTLPNRASVYPRLLMGRHWFYYAPEEHLFYFTPQTIGRLLEDVGFAGIRVGRAYKTLRLDYAAEALRHFNERLGRIAQALVSRMPRLVSSRPFSVYLGEMRVVAENPG